jgi:hypothetical protein
MQRDQIYLLDILEAARLAVSYVGLCQGDVVSEDSGMEVVFFEVQVA